MTNYTGWVPTNTGALSFSSIGYQYKFSNRIFGYNKTLDDDLNVYVVEPRKLRQDDSFYAGVVSMLPTGAQIFYNNDTHFVLHAVCENQCNRNSPLRGVIKCVSGDLQYEDLESARGSAEFDALFDDEINKATLIFSVEFLLERTGQVTFENFLQSENLSLYDPNEEFDKSATYQSYMFLRDMAHRHKHHHHGDDKFLGLKASTEDWKDSVAFDLGRQIIRQPKSSVSSTYLDVIGVTAYLETFQNLFLKKSPIYSEDQLASLRESLKSENQRIVTRNTDRRYRWGLIIAFLTLIVGKSVNFRDGISKAEYASLIFLGVMALIAMQHGAFFSIKNNRFSRSVAPVFTKPNWEPLFVILFGSIALVSFMLAYRILN